MAIYLQLPPGSVGDANDSWAANRAHPYRASANRATERRMSPQLRPGCLRPGLFKSANGWFLGSEELWEM